MLLTVSGMQTHAPDPSKPAPDFPPPLSRVSRQRDSTLSEKEIDLLPRVFSQTFVLSPVATNASQFVIVSESFRFVG
jgi:hypothetical protein